MPTPRTGTMGLRRAAPSPVWPLVHAGLKWCDSKDDTGRSLGVTCRVAVRLPQSIHAHGWVPTADPPAPQGEGGARDRRVAPGSTWTPAALTPLGAQLTHPLPAGHREEGAVSLLHRGGCCSPPIPHSRQTQALGADLHLLVSQSRDPPPSSPAVSEHLRAESQLALNGIIGQRRERVEAARCGRRAGPGLELRELGGGPSGDLGTLKAQRGHSQEGGLAQCPSSPMFSAQVTSRTRSHRGAPTAPLTLAQLRHPETLGSGVGSRCSQGRGC